MSEIWEPVAWALKDEFSKMDGLPCVSIHRTNSPFYVGERFAVRISGRCLNIHGQWGWEPPPSARDDAFYEQCRFKTIDEAAGCFARVGGNPYRGKIAIVDEVKEED